MNDRRAAALGALTSLLALAGYAVLAGIAPPPSPSHGRGSPACCLR